jgi:hypothetical protein
MTDQQPDHGPYFEGFMPGTAVEVHRCPVCGAARRSDAEIREHISGSHPKRDRSMQARAAASGLVIARR